MFLRVFRLLLLVLGLPCYNDSLFVGVLLQFVIQSFDFIILVFTLLAEFSYFLLIFLFHFLHFFGIFLQIRKFSVRSMIRQVSSERHHLRAQLQTRYQLSTEGESMIAQYCVVFTWTSKSTYPTLQGVGTGRSKAGNTNRGLKVNRPIS